VNPFVQAAEQGSFGSEHQEERTCPLMPILNKGSSLMMMAQR